MPKNKSKSRATSRSFAKALEGKSSTELYALVDPSCLWHVGAFIGTLKGADQCVGYFQKIFRSYKNLNFSLRLASYSPVSSTIEYRLAENKITTKPEEFTGVFILYINQNTGKIELIKSYYEDRTQSTKKTAVVSNTSRTTRRATPAPKKIPAPYDPVTGLPL